MGTGSIGVEVASYHRPSGSLGHAEELPRPRLSAPEGLLFASESGAAVPSKPFRRDHLWGSRLGV